MNFEASVLRTTSHQLIEGNGAQPIQECKVLVKRKESSEGDELEVQLPQRSPELATM